MIKSVRENGHVSVEIMANGEVALVFELQGVLRSIKETLVEGGDYDNEGASAILLHVCATELYRNEEE